MSYDLIKSINLVFCIKNPLGLSSTKKLFVTFEFIALAAFRITFAIQPWTRVVLQVCL